MPKLPRGVSGQQMRKVLEKLGFACTRQKGSHMVLHRAQILSDSNLSVDEFLKLL